MFNVACTEDGINGLPGGFGSGEDDAPVEDKEDKERDEDLKKDRGLYVPGDGEISQATSNLNQREED